MAVVTSTSVCSGLASFLQAHFARIMAGMDQKDTYAVGFGGDYAPRVMFPSGVARPKMLRILAGMHQEDSYAVFTGDDAVPVSSGKYSGTFVFTAPVAEPTLVSFTVSLVGCSIVATASVVTTCST